MANGKKSPKQHRNERRIWKLLAKRQGIKDPWPKFFAKLGPQPFNAYQPKRQWQRPARFKSILSFDPGTRNMAVCWTLNGKVQFCGHLSNPLNEIKQGNFAQSLEKFRQEINYLLQYTKAEAVVAERFMARAFSTKTIELVGFMLGMMAATCYNHQVVFELVTSAQWKTALGKWGELGTLYQIGKKKYGLEPHPIDAICIGHYFSNGNQFTAKSKAWISSSLGRAIHPFSIGE